MIHNALPLQSAWAKEHGYELTGNRLLLEQLKTYKPEILFIQDSANFSAAFIKKIREEIGSLKLIIGHCCAPYNNESIKAFRQYNVILACSKRFLEDFKNRNINSYLFPHAVESSLVKQMGETIDIFAFENLTLENELIQKIDPGQIENVKLSGRTIVLLIKKEAL